MKILIIDNGSKYTTELIQIAKGNEGNDVVVQKYDQIDFEAAALVDLIILSGGHGHSVINHHKDYADELRLISHSGKPILGICLGCELVAYAFNSDIEYLDLPEKESIKLEILEPDPVSELFTDIKVQESHKWYINKLGTELRALAKSKDGIEIIKHKDMPIYGVQFHPELNPQLGAELIHRITSAIINS